MVRQATTVADGGGYWLEVPDNAKPGQYTQQIVGEIDFPPEKALTC